MSIEETVAIAADAATEEKAPAMTKLEMVQKMLADQQIIREARQNGISYEEIEKTYGFKFARLPHISNQ
jgi:hypothetical protein